MSGALATLHQELQDLVGRTVAERYRVDSLVGVGGMAAVFRAHHLGLGRDVALKVLHPNLSSNTEISGRFDREAKSASRLDHPNCVQVTDYGSTEDGMKFMVMQLLEGRELTHLLEKRIDSPRAVGLILQILRGLEHAHKQGVVHRDVKPENVFVTRDHENEEVLKLVDFGIAKLMGPATGDTHKTTAGLVFGTPAYMSPEQAMGVEADSRSDLYSVGVLFYQMLAGRMPIDNEDPVALVRMQVTIDPDPLPSSVPPVIAAVVGRLLEKDRDARFQSATEALETLEGIEPLLVDEHISEVEIVVAANTGTTSVLIDTSRKPTAQTAAGRPRWMVPAAIAAVTIVGLATMAALGGSDEPAISEGDETSEVAERGDDGPLESAAATAGPPAQVLSEIDRLLLAKKVDEADALLAPLRDEFPKDATLLWRQGKVLAEQKRKEAQALAAYGDALRADSSLLDNKDFYAELHDLMRDRRVRDEALDLALQHMGPQGHKFLLELVNDERRPLQYNDRHRALDELREDTANAPLVNVKLNRALDVLQAAASLTPCTAYSEALDAIEQDPDFYYFNRVDKAELPVTPEDPKKVTQDDISSCEGLPQRREELLARLAVLHPEAEEFIEGEGTASPSGGEEPAQAGAPAPAPPPEEPAPAKPKAKPKSKSGKSRGSRNRTNTADCNKFLGGLKKKCRR